MIEQANLFGDTIYDALEGLVAALGGNKRAGYELWPDDGPEKAGQRLRDSMNPKRRENLKPHELIHLLQMGQAKGIHTALWHICDECDYEQPAPVNREQQVAELQKEFISTVSQLDELAKALKAKGVKLEAV